MIDMNPKDLPVRNNPGAIPINDRGSIAKIISGSFKVANKNTHIVNMIVPCSGSVENTAATFCSAHNILHPIQFIIIW